MRRPLALLALCSACSWTLPAPDVRDAGARDAAADVQRDSSVGDAPAPVDSPSPVDAGTDRGPADVGADRGGVDAPVLPADAGVDASRPDVPVDLGGAVDLGPPDVPTDRGADVSAPVDAGTCTPGERRACYPGPAASRGRGYCRDGVETCDAGGRWGGTCANSVVPDCTGRTCGSDDCGGSCGPSCAAGQVCDEVGRCVVPPCGASSFVVACDKGVVCPANSICTADNLCSCLPGYIARTCAGADCGLSCAYPNWYCARAGFCGSGAVACRGGFTCPRHSECNEATRGCTCAPGYMAVTCGGDRCTACPGTEYRCIPAA